MRAVRFVSQLGFDIENETLQALEQYGHLLKNIAIERITMEMEKLLAGSHKAKALQLMEEIGLYDVLPSLIDQESLQAIKELSVQTLTEEEMWLLFLFVNEVELEAALKLWRFSTKKIRFLKKAMFYLQKRMKGHWSTYDLYDAKEAVIVAVEHVWQAVTKSEETEGLTSLLHRYEGVPIKEQAELVISGRELMEWKNRRGGPWLKELLLKIEKAIVEGELMNEEAAIKRWVENDND